jgi:hypothetical protein
MGGGCFCFNQRKMLCSHQVHNQPIELRSSSYHLAIIKDTMHPRRPWLKWMDIAISYFLIAFEYGKILRPWPLQSHKEMFNRAVII